MIFLGILYILNLVNIMNQILQTDLKNKNSIIYDFNEDYSNYTSKQFKKYKKIFKLQLYASSLLLSSILIYFISYRIQLDKSEKYSSHILSNYNITRLYADSTYSVQNGSTNSTENQVLGIIEIPSIRIYYPIFANCNEELLKISPCRFYGTIPGNKRKSMHCRTQL